MSGPDEATGCFGVVAGDSGSDSLILRLAMADGEHMSTLVIRLAASVCLSVFTMILSLLGGKKGCGLDGDFSPSVAVHAYEWRLSEGRSRPGRCRVAAPTLVHLRVSSLWLFAELRTVRFRRLPADQCQLR